MVGAELKREWRGQPMLWCYGPAGGSFMPEAYCLPFSSRPKKHFGDLRRLDNHSTVCSPWGRLSYLQAPGDFGCFLYRSAISIGFPRIRQPVYKIWVNCASGLVLKRRKW